MIPMRTRFLPKMTHGEVCQYLERNDIIYVPLGTCEVHGTFPLDVETTAPEAFAKLMAEETDGLVLGSLPYFFCGASPISPGTIQMSVADGLHYLKAIAHSLLNQGFRRQVYLSLHGPAFLTGGALAVDFFDETKCPIGYVDMINGCQYASEKGVRFTYDDVFYGAYEILGRKDELVVDPNLDTFEKTSSETAIDETDVFRRFAHPSGSIGFYFARPEDHAGMTGALKTVEERDEKCRAGADILRKIVQAMEMPLYVEQMRALDAQHQNVILPRYGNILPRNRYPAPESGK
jgi:creatinine amidohydrolase